jgi:hypothetical protein
LNLGGYHPTHRRPYHWSEDKARSTPEPSTWPGERDDPQRDLKLMTEERKEIAESPSGADDSPKRLSGADMLDQLQVMARQLAGDAPPVLREASVVAAELAAIAARGTGPIARTLGEATDDATLRFAERMETYAASIRAADVVEADVSDNAGTEGIKPADDAELEDRS